MLFGRNKKNPITIADKKIEKWTYSTCGYCSTGCSIEIGTNKEGTPVSSRGVGGADVNQGKLCLKGIFEHELFESAGRGTTPLIRDDIHNPWDESGWDNATSKMASEIKRIQKKYGRDAFAIVSTGQILTEGFYTLGKLARGVIGTNNYDGNTTLCMASAVSGYKRSFGSDGPPGCYEDFEHTDCLIAWGSNLPEQHPIIYWRMKEAQEKRNFPLIVIDPRVTMLAQNADMHLTITPGTDVVLQNSLMHVILAEGLWLIGTNPMTSMPNTARIRKTLEKLECLIVQDSYEDVETTEYAHIFLPAAIWAEKEGCFTNTERRVNIVRKVKEPYANTKTDLQIFNEVAKHFDQSKKMTFPYAPAEVFNEMRHLSKGRLVDISGMTHDLIEKNRGIQWPYTEEQANNGEQPPQGGKRLYTENATFCHPGNKAKLIPLPFVNNNEVPDEQYPFWLNSGRLVEHFHTRTRTGKIGNNNKFSPTPFMEMNPDIAAEMGVTHQSYVRVVSRRSDAVVMVMLTQRVPRDMVFIPFHFFDCVNRLTLGLLDPHSRQPAFKQSAVRIEPINQEEGAKINKASRNF